MKKILSLLLCIILSFWGCSVHIWASGEEPDMDLSDNDSENSSVDVSGIEINAKSAVLMDAETGTVLFTKNASEALPPASVTKVMTLLLVAEAIADGTVTLEQKVMVSENASSMGGSQIFIKEGEEFTVEELLKSTVIASANDAAVALAELIAGSEGEFVKKMNDRAKELGMNNSVFENSTGLDDTVTNHLTSAYDIAVMSRELLKHDIITKYSNVWQDSIRDGEFILTNTNRLVRFYDGCTGLKTGSTDKAGFCVSATAKRDGLHLIAVIMGAESRDDRNNSARALLDYGFANFSILIDPESALESVPVTYGTVDEITVYSEHFSKLVNKSDKKRVEKIYNIPETLTAPLCEGDQVGEIVYKLDDEVIGKTAIVVRENVEKIGVLELFGRIIRVIFVGNASK